MTENSIYLIIIIFFLLIENENRHTPKEKKLKRDKTSLDRLSTPPANISIDCYSKVNAQRWSSN